MHGRTLRKLRTATLMMAVLGTGTVYAGSGEALADAWPMLASVSVSASNADPEADQDQSEQLDRSEAGEDTWFEHKQWMASCDNLRTCTAYAVAGVGYDESTIIAWVTRGGGASDMPKLMVLIESENDNAPLAGTSAEIRVDGPAAFKRSVSFSSDPEYEDVYVTARFSGSDARRIIAAIAQGNSLSVRALQTAPIVLRLTPQQPNASATIKASAPITLPLGGSAAVLRWVDERQKRAGGVTALVARGPATARAVPPVPKAPVVKRAQLPTQDNLPETVPARVLEMEEAKVCAESGLDHDLPEAELSAYVDAYLKNKENARIIARLKPGLLLGSISCGSGNYNYWSHFFLVSESGVRGLGLEEEDSEEADTLVNAYFDPESAELLTSSKYRGLGDCGDSETYVWDGAAFQPTEVRSMPECIGLHPGLWHVTYRAVVK